MANISSFKARLSIACCLLSLVLCSHGLLTAADAALPAAAAFSPVIIPAIAVPAGLVTSTHWSTDGGDQIRSVSVLLDPAMTLRLVDQHVTNRVNALTVKDLLSTPGVLAAINGGYFMPDFTPCGLVIDHGQVTSPLGQSPLLSGCVGVDAAGNISLSPRQDGVGARWQSALQAGPFLIDPGGALGIHPATPLSAVAARSLIARSASGRIALISTTAVTLYALACCLHDHPEGFGLADIDRCLNLDGGPSTSLAIIGAPAHPLISELARVRTALVVVAKIAH